MEQLGVWRQVPVEEFRAWPVAQVWQVVELSCTTQLVIVFGRHLFWVVSIKVPAEQASQTESDL